MPWKGPEVPGEFPTLGYQVADWIEERCAIPDREFVGNPFLLTDEELRVILNLYRLDPDTGRFVFHRGAQVVRPQKWGKGPLGAAVTWATPLIQVTAVSEDQTGNVYEALLPMIELGALHGEVEDTGLGRINLPRGGSIRPVTASAISRLGQRITFALQDQTESWTESNRGRKLADNQRRGLAGMGGRWLSTPNAWDPAENSVAQWTAEHEVEGVYHDDVTPPESLSIRNKVERRRALRLVYGDAVAGTRDGQKGAITPWIDLDRIEGEIKALIPRDPAQAERWFLNRKRATESAAFDGELYDSRASYREVEPRSLITLGVDGARFVDGLAIVATEVETGYQWSLGIWERPHAAPDDYQHPKDQVDGVMDEAFDTFDVWRVYVDPQWIEDWLFAPWQGKWGDKRVIAWHTNRPKQIAWAVRNYTDSLGDLEHDGDPDLTRHVKNAVRQKVNVYDDQHRQMHTISKDRPDSTRKMDGAMAAVLSWEARNDAIAAGAEGQQDKRVYIF
jgi:hypothetical protein